MSCMEKNKTKTKRKINHPPPFPPSVRAHGGSHGHQNRPGLHRAQRRGVVLRQKRLALPHHVLGERRHRALRLSQPPGLLGWPESRAVTYHFQNDDQRCQVPAAVSVFYFGVLLFCPRLCWGGIEVTLSCVFVLFLALCFGQPGFSLTDIEVPTLFKVVCAVYSSLEIFT